MSRTSSGGRKRRRSWKTEAKEDVVGEGESAKQEGI